MGFKQADAGFVFDLILISAEYSAPISSGQIL
jgi:hypothetical protein